MKMEGEEEWNKDVALLSSCKNVIKKTRDCENE